MYSKFQLTKKFIQYYCSSSNGKGHGTHSPFIFHFITKILGDRKSYPVYMEVETLRLQLKQDQTILTIEDFGAGSAISKSNKRTVASIAAHAAKPKKYGQLLYRMVKYYQPQSIIELGTSLGISTAYMALANPTAHVITMEGAREIAKEALNNFNKLKIENIQLVEGDINYSLPVLLDELSTVDFAFIDGNHRREPTERYFRELLEKTNNDSMLVFDDIHWSSDMELAWENIKAHPGVRCTIDLFFIGIVLFREEFREKQHFIIRF